MTKAPRIYTIQQLIDGDGTLLEGKKPLEFIIPDYQRGYRWTKAQADALIDDLNHYIREQGLSKDMNQTKIVSPYYLQPITVRSRDNNTYEVIDGQQRLTTICLLQFVLSQGKEGFCFKLNYENRDNWQEAFIYEIQKLGKNGKLIRNIAFSNQNQDYYHIAEVYDAIKSKRKDIEVWSSLKIWDHVKIIWNELESPDAVEKFTNLNSRKISLTCAELLKALFLQQNIYNGVGVEADSSISEEEDRLAMALRSLVSNTQKANALREKIAREWDEHERRLGNNKFWYFIFDKECDRVYDTRIEYIFNLMCGVERGEDHLKAFTMIYDELVKADSNSARLKKIQEKWDTVNRYMDTLLEWWKDKTLYHLIGYLVAVTPWIKKETNDKEENTSVISYLVRGVREDRWDKGELFKNIYKYVRESFRGFMDEKGDVIEDALTYENKDNIRRALLFFNVKTMINRKGDERFPFDEYKTIAWDIEHIASQTEFNVHKKEPKTKIEWSRFLLEYFTGKKANWTEESIEDSLSSCDKGNEKIDLCKKLLTYLGTGSDNCLTGVGKCLDSIFPNSGFTSDDKDSLGNLTLLNSEINRGYGNSVFPIKRLLIMQAVAEGTYVPLCTQMVFQKAYSVKLDQLYTWNDSDKDEYANMIIGSIKEYNK